MLALAGRVLARGGRPEAAVRIFSLLNRGILRSGTSRSRRARCLVAFVVGFLGASGSVALAAGASWMAVAPSASNNDALVTLIDLGVNAAGPVVQTPGAMAQLGVAVSPDGRTAYSVAAASNALVVVDLTTRSPGGSTG